AGGGRSGPARAGAPPPPRGGGGGGGPGAGAPAAGGGGPHPPGGGGGPAPRGAPPHLSPRRGQIEITTQKTSSSLVPCQGTHAPIDYSDNWPENPTGCKGKTLPTPHPREGGSREQAGGTSDGWRMSPPPLPTPYYLLPRRRRLTAPPAA